MANQKDNKQLLWQYAGLATQLLISLGGSLYIGKWLDRQIGWNRAILVWILPLVVLLATFIKLILDTSKNK
ncbi:MAG: hypothetical protein K2Q21_03535 [Chitinophagaceae bacterium]|nr:hypothetical protein [Chitinophagaceae bacterium]